MKFVIKLSSVTTLLLALISGGALFWVSQQVQQAERDQRRLAQIAIQEQEAIRVLNAEWDYLNRPDRLEQLAEQYLKMAPAQAEDLVQNVSAIPEPVIVPLPPRDRPTFASTAAQPMPAPALPKVSNSTVPAKPMVESEPSFEQILDGLEEGAQ